MRVPRHPYTDWVSPWYRPLASPSLQFTCVVLDRHGKKDVGQYHPVAVKHPPFLSR